MRNPKHSGWTAHPDDSHTAKIGHTSIEIHPARPWHFYRGDHGGEPTYVGPGSSRTIAFRGSHSGTAFTLEGAKAKALWTVLNDLTGKTAPDSVLPQEELDARRVWQETLAAIDGE